MKLELNLSLVFFYFRLSWGYKVLYYVFIDDKLLDAEVDPCLSIDDYKAALADVSIANSDDKYDSAVYDPVDKVTDLMEYEYVLLILCQYASKKVIHLNVYCLCRLKLQKFKCGEEFRVLYLGF